MRWRASIVLGLALWSALPAHAQRRPDDVRAPVVVDVPQLVRSYVKARARRNVGISLAGAGVALAILGGVTIGFGTSDRNQLAAGVELGAGTLSSALGLALAIPGVVLWTLGQDDMDVASWRRSQLLTARADASNPMAGWWPRCRSHG